jgi:hypothetical protein
MIFEIFSAKIRISKTLGRVRMLLICDKKITLALKKNANFYPKVIQQHGPLGR